MCPAIPTMPPPITMPRDNNNTTTVLETFDNDDAFWRLGGVGREGGGSSISSWAVDPSTLAWDDIFSTCNIY
eukprot:scaffold930_cov151-Skeletonema_marinoi.AAC.2